MKKTVLLLMIALLLPAMASAQSLVDVYIIDNDGPVTNIRNAPRGKVVSTLPTNESFVVTLLSSKGEWWKIDDVVMQEGDNFKEITLKGSKTGYWIHRSLLQFTIAGDPTGCLRTAPSAKSKAVKMSNSTELSFHPIAVKGKWVKAVSTDGKSTGWIHCDKICSNPLTTCP